MLEGASFSRHPLEILAPAGSEEALHSALNTGADAVYLGLTMFSARRSAANFDFDALGEAVGLCHASGVRVYVTVNTLIFDDELADFRRTIEKAAELHVDAFIVQDLGAAAIIREVCAVPLHGSTQMTVMSVKGAEMLKRLGFQRVVLARELALDAIGEICRESGIEVEVFVHGALCVCLSGQCYMSAVLGGRSGNRGLCAQPCRLDFTCERDERGHILSLKDLSAVALIPRLAEIGVAAIKIEGRMKRPEYVAAAVTACRQARDGGSPDMAQLRAVFSRSGFTDGYLRGDLRGMSGVRTREDVAESSAVMAELRRLYQKPYKRYTVDIDISIRLGSPVVCRVNSCGISAVCDFDPPEVAMVRSLTEADVVRQLEKMGGTVFSPGRICCDVGEGCMVSAGRLNEIRRGVLGEITRRRVEKHFGLTTDYSKLT